MKTALPQAIPQLYEPQDEKSKKLVAIINQNMDRIIEANKKLSELKKIVFTNFEKDLSLLTIENLELAQKDPKDPKDPSDKG